MIIFFLCWYIYKRLRICLRWFYFVCVYIYVSISFLNKTKVLYYIYILHSLYNNIINTPIFLFFIYIYFYVFSYFIPLYVSVSFFLCMIHWYLLLPFYFLKIKIVVIIHFIPKTFICIMYYFPSLDCWH